jgi:Rhodanese-related sulfurtransferase
MSYKRETPERIQTLINEKFVNIIDVRTPQEKNNDGFISKSILINIRSPDFNDKLNALDKETPIVLYCHAGNRSETAAQTAVGAGFKEIYMIEGGISAWKTKNLTVENV